MPPAPLIANGTRVRLRAIKYVEELEEVLGGVPLVGRVGVVNNRHSTGHLYTEIRVPGLEDQRLLFDADEFDVIPWEEDPDDNAYP